MSRTLALAAFTAILLVGSSAQQQPAHDGYELRQWLSYSATPHSGLDNNDAINTSFAIGYVTGVAEALKQPHTIFCIPEGVRQGEITDVVY